MGYWALVDPIDPSSGLIWIEDTPVPAPPDVGPTGVFTPSGGIIPWADAPYGVDIVNTPTGPAALPRPTNVNVAVGISGGNYVNPSGTPLSPVTSPVQAAVLPDLSKLFSGIKTTGSATGNIDPIMLMLLMQGNQNDQTMLMLYMMGAFGNAPLSINQQGQGIITTHPLPESSGFKWPWEAIGDVFTGLKNWIGGVQTPITGKLYY